MAGVGVSGGDVDFGMNGGTAGDDMGVGMNGGTARVGGDPARGCHPRCGCIHRRRYGGRFVTLNRPRTKGENELDCRFFLCGITYGVSELFMRCCCSNWGKYPPPDVDPDTGVPIDPNQLEVWKNL